MQPVVGVVVSAGLVNACSARLLCTVLMRNTKASWEPKLFMGGFCINWLVKHWVIEALLALLSLAPACMFLTSQTGVILMWVLHHPSEEATQLLASTGT